MLFRQLGFGHRQKTRLRGLLGGCVAETQDGWRRTGIRRRIPAGRGQ
jgi:hypothetical protein